MAMAEEARRRSWLDRPHQDCRLLEVPYHRASRYPSAVRVSASMYNNHTLTRCAELCATPPRNHQDHGSTATDLLRTSSVHVRTVRLTLLSKCLHWRRWPTIQRWGMLHTFMMSCLHKLVRVCLAVISLTAFSHRIFKHKTIVMYNISRANIIFSVAVRICSHSSYLLSFIDIFA